MSYYDYSSPDYFSYNSCGCESDWDWGSELGLSAYDPYEDDWFYTSDYDHDWVDEDLLYASDYDDVWVDPETGDVFVSEYEDILIDPLTGEVLVLDDSMHVSNFDPSEFPVDWPLHVSNRGHREGKGGVRGLVREAVASRLAGQRWGSSCPMTPASPCASCTACGTDLPPWHQPCYPCGCRPTLCGGWNRF